MTSSGYPSDLTYPLFPFCAFLGFVLALVPLPWHLQAWNSGTCYYMVWTSLACFNQFVNAVIWHGNAINSAPLWCDISIRISMGASVGIPVSSLCIVRRLYHIASVQLVSTTKAEKRRAVLVDTLMCVLFPLLFISWQYVVQGHRFDIFEDIGCHVALYNVLPAYFLSLMWPALIGLISAVYCVLALFAFRRRQVSFNQFLKNSSSSLTGSRYLRLMALAMTETMFTTPLSLVFIFLDVFTMPVQPWISWSDTHFDYSRVDLIPGLLWRQNKLIVVALELNRWLMPACAFIFFAFFGFAEEARKNYKLALTFICRLLRLTSLQAKQALPAKTPLKSFTSLASTGSLPVFIGTPLHTKSEMGFLPATSSIDPTTPSPPTSGYVFGRGQSQFCDDVPPAYSSSPSTSRSRRCPLTPVSTNRHGDIVVTPTAYDVDHFRHSSLTMAAQSSCSLSISSIPCPTTPSSPTINVEIPSPEMHISYPRTYDTKRHISLNDVSDPGDRV